MSTARLASIPFDHLIAEMAAVPLGSEDAFRLSVTELNPRVGEPDSRFGSATASLWRAAERHTLECFPAFSVDEAVAIRDHLWFSPGGNGPVPLHTYFRRLARQFLEVRGATVTPVIECGPRPAGPSEREPREVWARQAWRWLSFALPSDLLLAALGTPQGCPEMVELISPALDRHLRDKRYAEPHLHIGAAMAFPALWVSALRAIADTDFSADAFQSPGAMFDEGRALAPWLLRAAIARYVLAAYLSWGRRENHDFRGFLDTSVRRRVIERLGASLFSSLHAGLAELMHGTFRTPGTAYASLRSLYAQLNGGALSSKPFPNALEAVQNADPIGVFYRSNRPGQPAPEVQFVSGGLSYLDDSPGDRCFAVLFWQIIRIRVLFYRHVVQRPMTPGLQWFIRFYGRIKPARRPMTMRLLVQSAAEMGGRNKGLRSLEFRTSPYSQRSPLLADIKAADETVHNSQAMSSLLRPARTPLVDYVRAVRSARQSLSVDNWSEAGSFSRSCPFEAGIVFHFTKDRGGGARAGEPNAHWQGGNADPRISAVGSRRTGENPTGYRYARFYNAKRNEALALSWMLWHFPMSLEIIRGLDVATDELGVPTWVLAPLYRYLRKVGDAVSKVLRQRCGVNVPALRGTVHTGEDFIHLLTGLRNVDEAVRRLDLREGDRIGHGLSLGIDPREWCDRAGRIAMPREERLLDLAWECTWYGREGIDPPGGRSEFIEREISRLSHRIFGKPIRPYDIELFIERLHDESCLWLVGFPNGSPLSLAAIPDESLKLLQGYLTARSVFERGHELEWVDPSSEAEALAMLQGQIRGKLGQRGITVEVNPSSNLLIGDLCDLGRHPLWRLMPPKALGDAPPVSVCIGSDDPLTFGTNLRQEYQFVHDALIIAGLSKDDADRWLDRVREAGLNNRFTVPRRLAPIDAVFNPDEVPVNRPL